MSRTNRRRLRKALLLASLGLWSTSRMVHTDAQSVESWSMYQHDARHTGQTLLAGPSTNTTRPLFDLGVGQSLAAPMVGPSGLVYFVNHVANTPNWQALAVDAAGVIAIQTDPQVSPCRGDVSHPTIAQDGSFYIIGGCNEAGDIFGFYPGGQLHWRTSLSGGGGAVVLGLDGTLYVTSGFWQNSEVTLRALTPDGVELWRYIYDNGPTSPVLAAVAPNGHVIVVGITGFGFGAFVEAHDPGTGSLLWRRSPSIGSGPTSSPSIADDGTIYFMFGGRLYAWPGDGGLTERWSLSLVDLVVYTSTPAQAPNGAVRVVTGPTDTFPAQLHSVLPSGVREWPALDLTPGRSSIPPAEVAVDNAGNSYVSLSALCSTACPLIFAVDPGGQEFWRYSSTGPAGPSSPLAIGTPGAAVFGLVDGTSTKLYLIGAATPAPTLTSITPNSGPPAGGTSVTIIGTGFTAGATLALGGSPATGVTVVDSTTMTAVTGPHTAGTVDVLVTNPDGQSGTLTAAFVYAVPTPSPTLVIDGSSVSSRRQGETFLFTGELYTPDGWVTRTVTLAGQPTITLEAIRADAEGTLRWQFLADCSTSMGEYVVEARDEATGRSSNSVIERVLEGFCLAFPLPNTTPSTATITASFDHSTWYDQNGNYIAYRPDGTMLLYDGQRYEANGPVISQVSGDAASLSIEGTRFDWGGDLQAVSVQLEQIDRRGVVVRVTPVTPTQESATRLSVPLPPSLAAATYRLTVSNGGQPSNPASFEKRRNSALDISPILTWQLAGWFTYGDHLFLGAYDAHPGFDFDTVNGEDTPVKAAASGTIATVQPGVGQISISHVSQAGETYQSLYLHLSDCRVADRYFPVADRRCANLVGQAVEVGQVIGIAGNTGLGEPRNSVLREHLHFEVRKVIDGVARPIDPYGTFSGDPYRWVSGRLWK